MRLVIACFSVTIFIIPLYLTKLSEDVKLKIQNNYALELTFMTDLAFLFSLY